VYVDDVILSGNSPSEITSVKQLLQHKFCIKDLGKLKYFLGLEVSRTSKGIHICQKYALDILFESGMLASKPCSTPMIKRNKLLYDDTAPPYDQTAYRRRLIGHLLYLTTTRLDISFTVQHLSQFMQSPRQPHFDVAARVLRYIKGCPAQGLFFLADSDLQLKAFSDLDWATCPTTRRSIIGYCIFLRSSLISWR